MTKLPNILLLVADQQRYDCIGAGGLRPVQTPHLDALARDGAWFTNAYAHIPICSPARQSFLTGRRPEAFGSHWNYDLGPLVSALSSDDYAWPRDLAGIGYQSAYVGKWHVSPHEDPTAFGYGRYVPESDYDRFRCARYPAVQFTAGYRGERDPVPLPDTETHVMARWASEQIEQLSQTGHPWHVRLDFSGPHLPCRPAAPFDAMVQASDIVPWESFAESFVNKPYIQRQQLFSWGIEDYTWQDFAPMVARYFGMVSQIDDAIGQVLGTLDRLQLAADTIVIFTADHGDLCGAHRMLDKHYVLYDDVVRVPLIMRWPGRISAGQRITEFVYNFLDLPPTLLEWVGIPATGAPPGQFHGRSLAPLMQADRPTDWRRDVIATYHGQQFGLYSQRMIRTDSWKYIWNATDIDELYDLCNDPAELANRIQDPNVQDIVQDLRVRLFQQLVDQGDRQLDNQWIRRQLLDGRKR